MNRKAYFAIKICFIPSRVHILYLHTSVYSFCDANTVIFQNCPSPEHDTLHLVGKGRKPIQEACHV